MDNYGSSPPYRYPNPYFNPGNTPPYPYPPPPSPGSGPDPYASAPLPYPHPYQYQYQYPYPYPYPPNPSDSNNYPYPPPPPSTSSPGSFEFPITQPHYAYPYPYQAPPGWSTNVDGRVSQTSDEDDCYPPHSSSPHSYSPHPPHSSSPHPPLKHLMSNVWQYDNQTSAPPQPLLRHSNSVPNQEKKEECPPLEHLMSNVWQYDNQSSSPPQPLLRHSNSVPNQEKKEECPPLEHLMSNVWQYDNQTSSPPQPLLRHSNSVPIQEKKEEFPPLEHLMSNVWQYDNQTSSPPQPLLRHSNSVPIQEKKEEFPPLEHLMSNVWQYDNQTSSPPQPLLRHSNSVPNQEDKEEFPPLEHLMSNVWLYDNQTSSPPQPLLRHSNSVPIQENKEEFDGSPPRNSFSGFVPAYSGPGASSELSAYSGSLDDSVHYQSLQIVPTQYQGSLRICLLHGDLDICVHGAKYLPNMDMFHKTLEDMFGSLGGNVGNKIEGKVNRKITSDPYVSISVSNAVIGRTFVISNSENPVWEQHFYVPVAHHAAEVHFVVKDSDVVGSQLIGVVAIPVEQIYLGEKVHGTYPILNNNGKPCKPGAVLTLSIQYIPMDKLSIYQPGIGSGPDYIGVPGTYFPLRKGGTVTLYQDAHVPDGSLPNVILDNGMYYAHGKCWIDMFDAISQAKRLVYITGWSVWHKVRLVRDAGNASYYTLGDLLRSRSQEGVRVLLLVWDDPTSRSILGYKTDGVMATHDEDTRRFFKHSSVQVLLCPRIAAKRHSWAKQQEVGTIYTHHQKTLIVDADAGNNRRKIIAFVGGLDLCDGRYDTPHHPLFRTLHTLHKNDFHNPTFMGNVGGCPREPWHDLHSKIDGPAAYDVLTNFEERWLRAANPKGIKKLKSSFDDALLRIDRISDIMSVSDALNVGDDNPEAWHVQIFRSIDSSSVKGFPKEPKHASMKNLVCGKNVLIDMSIHTAYVKAIRSAQHFIYIENQYFIGSSYNWSNIKDLGANNLIPMEIALKISEKIRANERFAVYIVIPMWPEGVPTGAATQRILFWQHKTMQMMYETIYKALVEVGLEDAHSPQDYLNFFCLGNREVIDMYENVAVSGTLPPPANSPQANSRNSGRFMIYVHSKGMIVDDEYVILGSANINQRSMDGTRDTEIAMGAYQPDHTWARKQSYPHGEIHGYRMSLWAEHTGTLEDCFLQPESLECVKRVRTMGELNWNQFSAYEATEMTGHLLKYPVDVDRKGKVRPLPGHEEFPDVGGKIVGSFIAIQENLTI